MIWNEYAVNVLKAMWPDYSASKIAAKLHTTRDAVVGKAFRLKLDKPYTPPPTTIIKNIRRWSDEELKALDHCIKTNKSALKTQLYMARKFQPRTLDAVKMKMRDFGVNFRNDRKGIQSYLPIARLDKIPEVPDDTSCHWPTGDVGSLDFSFCGDPIFKKSYCETHYHIAYKPLNEKERDHE